MVQAVNDTPKSRSASRSKPAPGEGEPTFEQAIAQVESIIDRIESGQLGLEDSIAEYERGIGLLQRCRGVLAQAEQRIEDLTSQLSSGANPAPDDQPGRES